MILYIAGPMTGIRHFNLPAFFKAQEQLEAAGYGTINPSESDSPEVQRACLASEKGDWADLSPGASLHEIIRQNVDDVLSSDGLCVLPGSSLSAGALFEIALAERINLPIYDLAYWLRKAS